MRIVIALGGNALLKRHQPMTAGNQRANIRIACERIAQLSPEHQVVIAHGNGPQVGLLALQAAAYAEVDPYPLDVLGAQTEAMIGYVIEQELGHVLPGRAIATLLTQVEVSRDDPAFADPTKPIGPVYDREEAERLHEEKGWAVKPDGDSWRRVVASPRPLRILALDSIAHLLDHGTIVVCAGGGGIPAAYDDEGRLVGVEAVIDKDLASSLLARELGADLLVIATDVDGIYRGFGRPDAERLGAVTPAELAGLDLPEGSMGPKAGAAAEFVRATGRRAAIGALADIADIVAGQAGTQVTA